ncbi:hypothetical protein [Hymenobacter lapidiphilus]|uniref:Uncharacterized protein n=1 Tax=Hymenobacter lapidiphilus TaxID=2608003 RepID=A0A7Y7PR03_9BACT|nr:hypothetical protein [Hymenobacter lapidiphilus]NVO32300.1 hypothetical protein [Hymenobacter lapidiphilus]
MEKRAVDNERVPEQGHFATAGEQDEYWARKLFQEKYLYHEYARFKGPILVSSGEGKYRLSYARDTLMAELNPAFRPLLTEGILYPHVAGFSFQNICCFRELPHATNSPQRRRLVFWSFEPLMLNPTVYVLEVKNSQATENTDLETFLKGAVLTFIQEGWIII